LCPEDHLKAFLKRDTRPDGRSLEEFRPIIIAPNVLNSCDSSCLVRLGATKVMCGIKAELVKPEADSPKSGMVSVNFEFSSVSSSNQRSGPPTEKAQSISIFVNNILKGILDLTEIGIKEDELAWSIFVDIYCLEDDGNTNDAALLSTIKSLQNLELPTVEFSETGNEKKVDTEKKKKAFEMKKIPISTTFGEFNGILLIDPTLKETDLGSAPITVVCSEKGEVLNFHRGGGFALSQEVTKVAVDTAQRRSKEMFQKFFS